MTDPISESEELELRGRITVLEEWCAQADTVLRFTLLAATAAAVTFLTLTLILRKRAAG